MTGKIKRLNINIPCYVYNALDKEANKLNTTTSFLVSAILAAYFCKDLASRQGKEEDFANPQGLQP